jgi:hypothetical protein
MSRLLGLATSLSQSVYHYTAPKMFVPSEATVRHVGSEPSAVNSVGTLSMRCTVFSSVHV